MSKTGLKHAPPSSWIISVPKKGDLTTAAYYRVISLMTIAAKVYNKLFLNRIFPSLDPLLRKNKNAFSEEADQ